MMTLAEIETAVNEFPINTMAGRLARETLRVRKILREYMDAEHEIRWAFMQFRDGKEMAPDFDNPADIKRFLIDPALEHLYPAADEATILSIILNACLKTGIDNTEHYELSSQIVTRILKTTR